MSVFYNQFWKKQSTHEMFDFPYKWPVISEYIPTKKMTILDYGCGHGKIMEELKKINPNSKYIGADVSKLALKMAKKIHSKDKFILVEDGEKFPLKSKSVDFILAADVVEHAFYTELLFSEFARVLKPKGQILISTPYHGVVKNIVISLIGFEKVFNPVEAHIRFFTVKSLIKMITDVKLKVVKKGYFGRFYPLSRGMFVLASK